jgi:FMN reductase (NADPH)
VESQIPRLSPTEFIRSLSRILAGKPRVPAPLMDHPLLAVILNRRSVRRFSQRPLPAEIVEAILEAGRLAPSTVNLQTWSFAAFTPETWQIAFAQPVPFKAPFAVIVMGDLYRCEPIMQALPDSPLVEYTLAVMNASLAAMNMNMAAEALGVASVMLSETGRSGLLDAGFLQERMRLPHGVFPLMTVVFGYPAGAYPPMPPKLPLNQICFRDGVYHEVDPFIMRDWLAQMTAGYKASHIFSSLQAQLDIYRSKIGPAESNLNRMIFWKNSAQKIKDQVD